MNNQNQDKIIIAIVFMGKRLMNFTYAFQALIPLIQSSGNETEREKALPSPV